MRKIFLNKIFGKILLKKLYKNMEKLISSELPSEDIGSSVTSKNLDKVKLDRKLNKKLAKAVNIILFHENKKLPELFSEVPSKNLWLYHFGNGDEDDQITLREYFKNKFGNCKVYIFPGISYGFVEFENISDAEKVINYKEQNSKIDFDSQKIKGNAHVVSFQNSGEKTIFTFYSNVNLEDVNQNNLSNFPIANYKVDIPGLYIIDDFINEDEEKELVESIDSNQWNKLSNRKVQHYGYEFLYGVNSINKNKKVGELPDFCQNLLKSI
jgi:alkylated DNA repair protein alkB family protein 8